MSVDCNRDCENCLSCTCIVDEEYFQKPNKSTIHFNSSEEKEWFEKEYCRDKNWDF